MVSRPRGPHSSDVLPLAETPAATHSVAMCRAPRPTSPFPTTSLTPGRSQPTLLDTSRPRPGCWVLAGGGHGTRKEPNFTGGGASRPPAQKPGHCCVTAARGRRRICGPGAQSKRGALSFFPAPPALSWWLLFALQSHAPRRRDTGGASTEPHRRGAQGGGGAGPGEGGSWDLVRPSCPLHSRSPSRQTCLPNGKFKDKNLTDPTW